MSSWPSRSTSTNCGRSWARCHRRLPDDGRHKGLTRPVYVSTEHGNFLVAAVLSKVRSLVVRSVALTLMFVLLLAKADAEAVRATLHRYVTAWLAGDSEAVMRELSPDAVFIPTDKAPYVGAQ